MTFIAYLIVILGLINLLRMTAFLVGSEIYSTRHHLHARRKKKHTANAFVSIVIPAHNEEITIIRALRSIVRNNYPRDKREIIVIDDGSTDRTSHIVKAYVKRYGVKNVTLVRQPNGGKARALNNGMQGHANGELIMCLDADSCLAPDGIRHAVRYFDDETIVAVASNVKIIPGSGYLNLVQRLEFVVNYQIKRALTTFNIEYIIGGIGSVFRKSMLEKVGYYDGNTVTEDIDLTMKMLQYGNKKHRLVYGADVIAHTEGVLDLKSLIRQRYRWKWGRCQTFLKNRNLFFNTDKRFTKGLTFIYLPYIIFGELAFLLEPLLTGIIFYIIIRYRDLYTILSAFLIMWIFIVFNIIAENTFTLKEKVELFLISPIMYFLFYILNFVEYAALIKSLIRLPWLQKSIDSNICGWNHVARGSAGGQSL